MANEVTKHKHNGKLVAKHKNTGRRRCQMRLLSTRTMANDVAKQKNNANEVAKHKKDTK